MRNVIMYGLLISIILACGISYFASKSPDGLERVAHDKGFLEKGEGKEVFKAPLPDYAVTFIKNDAVSNLIAGLTGTLIVFGLAIGLGLLIKRKGSHS